jgi:hypothetical protein
MAKKEPEITIEVKFVRNGDPEQLLQEFSKILFDDMVARGVFDRVETGEKS